MVALDKFDFDSIMLLCWSFNIQKAIAEYLKTHTYITRQEYETLVGNELSRMEIPKDVLKELGIDEEDK